MGGIKSANSVIELSHLIWWFPTRQLLLLVSVTMTAASAFFFFSIYMLLSKCSYLLDQNFLFTTKDESSELKAIDFGLSDFVKPGLSSPFYIGLTVGHFNSSVNR